ncbi:unnamed protein product [Brachionus calyciflorus]|uniref:Rab-GAP TBC domain-containing protein n=1 Tax=Brachionus calyciflorus TaxID=104777 RepID=A0A813P7T1_9BILA|nr:unnamed protein product [Brachionus calyciflorus]
MNQPIDSKKFMSFFDQDYRLVKEHELRKAIFKDGIEEKYREVAWKFLFQFYPFNSTKRERFIKRNEKLFEYALMKNRWSKIYENIINSGAKEEYYDQIPTPSIDFNVKIEINQDFYKEKQNQSDSDFIEESQDLNFDYLKIQTLLNISSKNIINSKLVSDIRQIDKDIERTSYFNELSNYETEDKIKKLMDSLKNLLITFSAFNQYSSKEMGLAGKCDLGYTQGMNEIASVFLSAFKEESVAYWCFSNYMLNDTYSNSSLTLNTEKIADSHVLKTSVAHYFSDYGINTKLKHLKFLLGVIDPELNKKLVELKLQDMNFCHEWLLLSFKRCFNSTIAYQKCFEILSSRFIEFHHAALKNIVVRNVYSFDLFICLSLLRQLREKIVKNCHDESEFYEAFSEFNKSKFFQENFEKIIHDSQEIFGKYCIISNSVIQSDNEKNGNNSKTFAKIKDLFF